MRTRRLGLGTGPHGFARLIGNVLEHFERWTQVFLPSSPLADERESLRARITLATVVCLIGVVVTGWIVRTAIGSLPWYTHTIVVVGLALLASAAVAIRRGRLFGAGVTTIIGFLVIIFGTALQVGGFQAPVLMFAPFLPLLATVLLDFRSGLWTTVATSTLLLGCLALAEAELLAPSPLEGMDKTRARALLALIAVVMSILLAYFYEKYRRLVDQRSETSEALYRNLFELSKDPVVVSTPAGALLDANPAAVEFYGFASKDDMLRRTVQEAYQDVGQRQELLRLLERDGFVRGYETDQKLRDGRVRIIRGTTSAVRGEDGTVEKLLAQLHDITEERQASIEIQNMVELLESKNQELERFAFTVSHDLKGPLVTLKGFMGLLAKDLKAQQMEKVGKDMAAIRRAADTMQALVDDLLEYSRLGHGSGTWAEIGLRSVALDVTTLLAGQTEARNIEVHIESDLPVLFGQLTLLRMLVQNLVENAIKYAARQVTIGALPGDSLEVAFFVRDDGPGIDPSQHKLIFGLFEKLDSQSQGTGIGLASVQRIVELHHGKIEVDSELGRGATFICRLPSRARWKVHPGEVPENDPPGG